MKLIVFSLFTIMSLSSYAQIRPDGSNAQSGTLTAGYQTATDKCRLGAAFEVDASNSNTTSVGHTLCRQAGSVGTDNFTVLPGGNWRMTTGDIDPAAAPCRLEGTVTTTSLIALSCGVDP